MRENNIRNINKSFYFKINLKIPIRKLKLFYYLFRENSIEIMQFHFNDSFFLQKLCEINVCTNRIIRVYLNQQKVFGLTITTVNSVQTNIISRNFWAFQNIHTVEVKPYWKNVYFELNDF